MEALKEAKAKAERDAELALWHEVHRSRAFKNMSPNAKILVGKEKILGLLEKLKDISYLNQLELRARNLGGK